MPYILYYDGQCPFCSKFAQYVRIKECFDLQLVDANLDHSWQKQCPHLRLDEGVILYGGGKCLQGEKALQKLYSACPKKGLLWNVQKMIFDSPLLGRWVYSLAKGLRNILKKERS